MKVFLRDNFAANILTSFTKVWSAPLYGGCYFVTGAYLFSADPSSAEGAARYAQCTASTQLHFTMVCVQLLPLVIRFLQCLRQRRDSFLAPKTFAVVQVQPAMDYTEQPSLEDTLELNLAEHAEYFPPSPHYPNTDIDVEQMQPADPITPPTTTTNATTGMSFLEISRSSSDDSDNTEAPFMAPTTVSTNTTGISPRKLSALHATTSHHVGSRARAVESTTVYSALGLSARGGIVYLSRRTAE